MQTRLSKCCPVWYCFKHQQIESTDLRCSPELNVQFLHHQTAIALHYLQAKLYVKLHPSRHQFTLFILQNRYLFTP
jgi:hypothetical protein